jgi:hypothetical protein
MKKLFEKINKFLMRNIGFILYPLDKCGKEEKNKIVHDHYK